MARYTGPKYKICRRVAENLWGRPKDPSIKRPYPTGQHGAARRKKPTNYCIHLMEKQKLRLYYGMLEKQFRRTFKKAARMRGNTGNNLMELLESRLDTVIYRIGFMPTIWAARQWVNHGHVLVNGKKVDIASYHVNAGDEISIREKSRKNVILLETIQNNAAGSVAAYLSRNDESFSGKMEAVPSEISLPFKPDLNLIIEFYSR